MKMIYVRWKRSESRTGSGLMRGVSSRIFLFFIHIAWQSDISVVQYQSLRRDVCVVSSLCFLLSTCHRRFTSWTPPLATEKSLLHTPQWTYQGSFLLFVMQLSYLAFTKTLGLPSYRSQLTHLYLPISPCANSGIVLTASGTGGLQSDVWDNHRNSGTVGKYSMNHAIYTKRSGKTAVHILLT